MDKHTGTYQYTATQRPSSAAASVLPDKQDFSAYALFPDAGDFTGLESPLPPPDTPPLSYAVSAPDSTYRQIQTPEPAAIPRKPPEPPKPAVTSSSAPGRSPFRHLLHLFYAACAVLALFIYGNMLFSGGTSLLAEGLEKLALRSVFGADSSVSVLAPAEETANLRSPETMEDSLSAPESAAPGEAPPARENPTPLPSYSPDNRNLASTAKNGLALINETPYTPDLAELASRSPVIDSYASLESIYGNDAPAVLILHTHGTEAFLDQADRNYHTEDRTKNICAVGEALAATLTEAGIGVLHCTELFDADSFDMAYYNAARYIRQALEDNPSIRYILDIHRDAITAEDGTGIRPLSVHDNTEYAQLMFVVGTDHGGSGHSGWENNLSLAARLQSALHGINPTLMRDINLRSASFNAQYAPGALLVEAGAACSTLEEAVRSIEVFGKALAEEILGE